MTDNAGFPSDEWLAALVGVGTGPGPSGAIQFVVTGSPDGEISGILRLEDGVVVEAMRGPESSAEVTLTASFADASAMAARQLDPSVAFMQGRMKTAGDPGLLLELLGHASTLLRRAAGPGERASR